MNRTPLTEQNIAEALSFAKQGVRGAGEIALRYFRQTLAVDNKLGKGSFDPVTQADREVEAYLREELTRYCPDFGVIGEEDGATPGTTEVNWIVDPIDGTKAFISGFPTWGILVGLQQEDRVLAGLMYQPATGELFYGSAAGAFLENKGQTLAMQSRQNVRLEEALLYCTHESMFANQDNLVVEDTLQPYDIVPLIPIIEASGGVITDADGKTPVGGGFVVAAADKE